ncbi:hypothetical protein [Nostoc sp.]|uniref:hypothetical protein n=1 Tax=Nostoc sp. TaxID=1180 RepID=UPI002FFB467A
MGHGAWGMGHGKEFSVCSLAFLTMPNAQFGDFLPQLLLYGWYLEVVIKIALENSMADT